MSAYRRAYNARGRRSADTLDALDTLAARLSNPSADSSTTATATRPASPFPYAITAPDWDEEAIETARENAHMLLDLDPNDETAITLIHKAHLAELRLRGEGANDANDAAAVAAVATAPEADEPDESAPDAYESEPTPASTASTAAAAATLTPEPFDPMRMFAQLAHYYPSFSDAAMRKMPWKRLMAYHREAMRQIEEENQAVKDAQDDAKRNAHKPQPAQAMVDGKPVDPNYAAAQLGSYVPRAQVYEGQTVRIVD